MRLVVYLAILALAACQQQTATPHLPPLAVYTPEEQREIAVEVKALPEHSILRTRVLPDTLFLRDQIRAGQE